MKFQATLVGKEKKQTEVSFQDVLTAAQEKNIDPVNDLITIKGKTIKFSSLEPIIENVDDTRMAKLEKLVEVLTSEVSELKKVGK